MQSLKEIVMDFIGYRQRKWEDTKTQFVLYKIVDSFKENWFYIQCINTKGFFEISLSELVFDLQILHGLHPIQACFTGIKYAQSLSLANNDSQQKPIGSGVMENRYGLYSLLWRTRAGLLVFEDTRDKNQWEMSAMQIASKKKIISEFDAAQAFHIGLLAGSEMKKKPVPSELNNHKKVSLRLVK